MTDDLMTKLAGDVEVEGEETVEEPIAEPTAEPEPEASKSEEVAPEPVKERPFHKNPKFMRLQQEAEELRKYRDDSERRFAELQEQIARVQTAPQAQTNEKVPDNLKHIFGDDVEAYKALTGSLVESYRGVTREELQNFVKQEETRAAQQQQATQKIIKDAEAALEGLSDETGIDFSTPDSDERNKLLDICEQYGINDFQKAYALYGQLYPAGQANVERKRIAGNTSSKALSASASQSGDKPLTKASLRKIKFNSFFT